MRKVSDAWRNGQIAAEIDRCKVAAVKPVTSTHLYKDAEDPDETFDVYKANEKWFWSFSPVWRSCGPFDTKKQAIAAGENFVDENGKPYIE